MASDDNMQFRMMLWPGVRLPLPPLVPRKDVYRLDPSERALIGTGMGVEVDASSHLGEIYLKLYALDLEDPPAILAFAREYGIPSGTLVYSALAHSSWFSPLFSPHVDIQARDAILHGDPALQRSMDIASPAWELTEIVTLESFRFAARLLRDLTNAWRLVKSDAGLEISSHRWELAYPIDDATKRSRFFALTLLGFGLTPLLARFHPYLAGASEPLDAEPEEPTTPNAGVHLKAASSLAFAHLAEFCALELFNHIAASEAHRHCQNCGQLFVRQYGRAEHGQSRLQGVMYCSRLCAQAKASRDYRQRRRVKERAKRE